MEPKAENSSSVFVHAATMMVLTAMSGALLAKLEETIFVYIAQRVTVQLRCDLFASILRQEVAFFEQSTETPSAFALRLGGGCERVSRALNHDIITAAQKLVILVGTIYAMTSLSWKLAMVPLAVVPFTRYFH